MAEVFPFKGVVYDRDYAKEEIMAPPYDVINDKEKKMLKEKSPFNIVRLTLPDSYDKAKETLSKWLNDGVLKFDEQCCFYSYQCDYEFEGKNIRLNGFIAALKVEEFGGSVKPHEKTLKGPKIDRFNLITKTNAMFCPIMGLYNHNKEIEEILNIDRESFFEEEFENIKHRIARITDKDQIRTIQNALKSESIIIADGHHRYETALMIKEYYNKQGIKEGGFDYIMILLLDAQTGGLSLNPIHRLVKKIDDFDAFLTELKRYFVIYSEDDGNWDFAMYDGEGFVYLRFKENKPSDLLKRLDVSIFEDYIYKKILNLTDKDIKNQRVAGYAHSKDELIELVNSKKARLGFVLKPMSFEELVEITNKGLTVPQKSTFFHPKIPSGLVGYHFKSIEGCRDV
ncbi:DUF1015 domain-containing protein [Hippea alviniae]|uniref:DUF1015 domain-containing protein n=1 Tax=Hippea alviniae TaxID=1279027 RepID=UPI0003B46831|nr:DUF1015 domain-containing protein [Hippea alviniae]